MNSRWSQSVDPLPRSRVVAREAFGNYPLKKQAVGVRAALQPADIVGGWNELLCEFDVLRIGPDQLSVDDAVVSRAGERVPIHYPQENRLVLVISTHNGGPEIGCPRNLVRRLEQRGRNDLGFDLLIVCLREEDLLAQDQCYSKHRVKFDGKEHLLVAGQFPSTTLRVWARFADNSGC